jgi:NADPH:quinone reductase-like Zn-dependent oxidoreductase
MQAITVRDRDAGVNGLSLTDLPYPHAAENDVIVQVHAAGFTRGERPPGKTIIRIVSA